DTEVITATEVTPGNSGDAEVAEDLLTDILPSEAEAEAEAEAEVPVEPAEQAAAYGDAAYGAGELLERLDNAG
ncbi:IS1182 family transposase, partial [Amycolatopsis balhimycina DSM 5908]